MRVSRTVRRLNQSTLKEINPEYSLEGLMPKLKQEMLVRSLGQEDTLEEGRATHSSILAWRIPGTEEPGGLQSIGLQRAEYD